MDKLLLPEAKAMKLVQARIYTADDYLKPDEVWSQLTFKVQGEDEKGRGATQHVLFERRQSDKISYYDWKLALVLENEDLKVLLASEEEVMRQASKDI